MYNIALFCSVQYNAIQCNAQYKIYGSTVFIVYHAFLYTLLCIEVYFTCMRTIYCTHCTALNCTGLMLYSAYYAFYLQHINTSSYHFYLPKHCAFLFLSEKKQTNVNPTKCDFQIEKSVASAQKRRKRKCKLLLATADVWT